MKKRILSLLLCFTLCFTLLPTSVFAEGKELDFSELQDEVWWFETSLNRDDYTEDSWAHASDCYEHASYLLNYRDTVTSQDQIDNALEELHQAINNLVSILHNIYFCGTCFQNGSVTSNKGSSAAAGEIITLTVLPGDGYALREDVTVEDPTMMNPSVECTKVNDKTYTFVMPEYTVEVCAIFVGESHSHRFTGAYKDNGDGTHSRKCTGCDEYGTAEAHSFTDGVCVCGAKDPAAELEEAKEAAISAIQEAAGDNMPTSLAMVVMNCATAISQATTVEEVNAARDAGIKSIQDELSKELTAAQKAALSAIQEAAAGNRAASVNKILILCKSAINRATTVEEVNAARDDGIKSIQDALAAAELDTAKKNAIAEINAKKNDENASVVDDAIAAIENAASVEEVTNLLNQASSDLDDLEVAEQKARYKEEITNKLLPAAECDEAREILNKALADLDNAETVSDLDSIMNNAEETASDKDDEFRDWRLESNLYFKDALTDVATDETKAFVTELEQALADATSIAQVKDIFNNNKSTIDFYCEKDNAIAFLNECISSDESSDDMKAIARECLSQVKTATTMDEFNAITAEFEPWMELQEAKDDFLAECNETLTSGEFSDETKSLIQDMMEEVKAAETIDELGVLTYKTEIIFECGEILSSDEYSDELKDIAQKICDEIKTAATADECDAVIKEYKQVFQQQLKKDEAKEKIEKLLPENASNAVKKIVSDACDEIQACGDPSKYDEIIENAKTAVEAQLQKEEELAPVKEAAIAEINDAKTAVNAGVAEDAIKAINNAQSEDEISTIKEQALTDMAEADAAAELAAAKEAAKAAIDDAVPADASDAVKAAAEKAKTAINAAKSVEDVNAAKEAGIAAIEDQIAADTAAAELAAAKEAAKEAILAEQGDDTSETVAKAVEDAIAAIDAATTVDEVNAAMEDGIAAIKDAKAGNVPPAPVTYSILDGANSVWTKGSTSGLIVRSDAPFAKFVGVKVDGKTIAATNYTAEEGSTIVTLNSAYLETLETGKHSIEIVSTDGSASTSFTVKANSQPADSTDPQTGDSSMIYLWALILAVSAAGLSATAIYSRKRKINTK